MCNTNQPPVLSLKKVSKILRRKLRQLRADVVGAYGVECHAENGEPLYHAEGLMRQLAYYLEDAKAEVLEEIRERPAALFDESNVRQIASSNLGR